MSIATMFDPLGLILLVVVRAKLMLKELWKLPINWDDALFTKMIKTNLHLLNNTSYNNTNIFNDDHVRAAVCILIEQLCL